MANMTAMLNEVLSWLTDVATWIILPGNQIYVIGFAVAIAGMVLGLMRRTFKKA